MVVWILYRSSRERANLIQSCAFDYVDFCSVRYSSFFHLHWSHRRRCLLLLLLLLRFDRFDTSFFLPLATFNLLNLQNFLIWFMVFVFS